jgi:hypothetical protein
LTGEMSLDKSRIREYSVSVLRQAVLMTTEIDIGNPERRSCTLGAALTAARIPTVTEPDLAAGAAEPRSELVDAGGPQVFMGMGAVWPCRAVRMAVRVGLADQNSRGRDTLARVQWR